MRVILQLLCVAACLAAARPSFASTTVQDEIQAIETSYGQLLSASNQAAVDLLNGNSAQAITDIQSVLALQAQLLAELQSPDIAVLNLKSVNSLISNLKTAGSDAQKALALLNAAQANLAAQVKAAQKVGKDDAKFDKTFNGGIKPFFTPANSGNVLILVELKPSSAGFHKAGDQVCFHVYGSASPLTITTNSSGSGSGAILSQVPAAPDANGNFCVTTGTQGGGVAITVSGGGKTATRLIYNYGTTPTSPPPPPKPAGKAFDGIWTGSFSGLFTYTNGSTYQYTNQYLDFTVTNGQVTSTSPINGTGSVDSSGHITWQPQANSGETPFIFQGTLTKSGTASGNWLLTIPTSNPGQSGVGNGSWSATLFKL